MNVTYDAKICVHAGECVKGSPTVFKVEDGQFVIDTNAAPEAEIRETVSKCPSGALQIQGQCFVLVRTLNKLFVDYLETTRESISSMINKVILMRYFSQGEI